MECLGGLRFGAAADRYHSVSISTEKAPPFTRSTNFCSSTPLRVSLRALPARKAARTRSFPPAACGKWVFERVEGILPYSDRSFLGYRLLQEYFSFPEKFFFFDLTGLDRLAKSGLRQRLRNPHLAQRPEQRHRLVSLEQNVTAETFQLGCTPIVNLFEQIAEPIRISQTKSEYRIVPDQHRQLSTEIYSVDRVTSTATYLDEPQDLRAFLCFAPRPPRRSAETFLVRPPAPLDLARTIRARKSISRWSISISTPLLPPVEMLSLRVTCTNRDQASRLNLTGEFGELRSRRCRPAAHTVSSQADARSARPPLRGGVQWRLISHLSLNHLSIVEKGRDALAGNSSAVRFLQ